MRQGGSTVCVRGESLWVWVRKKSDKVDVAVAVYYRSLKQDGGTHALLCKGLREISRPAGLVLTGNFSSPDVNSKHNQVQEILEG